MTKVSIIVPCYNVEKYLTECINSIINQTLKSIEIICVNDGSTDGTLSLLTNLSRGDNRIIIIDKKNSGYGDSMNIGILRAKGEYIGIVEPDDFIELDMFENLYLLAKKYNVDIVKSDYYRFDDIKNKEIIINNFHKKNNYNKVLNSQINKKIYRFTTSNWTGIYSSKLFKNKIIRHNTSPGAAYQDTGFRFLCYVVSKNVLYVDRPYYHYRYTNLNSSSNKKDNIYALENEYEYLKTALNKLNLYKKFADVYWMQRFCGFLWNYLRIGKNFKTEYVNYCSDLYNNYYNNNQINTSRFNPIEKHLFIVLITKPNKFSINIFKAPLIVKLKMYFWYIKNNGFKWTISTSLRAFKNAIINTFKKFKRTINQRK